MTFNVYRGHFIVSSQFWLFPVMFRALFCCGAETHVILIYGYALTSSGPAATSVMDHQQRQQAECRVLHPVQSFFPPVGTSLPYLD